MTNPRELPGGNVFDRYTEENFDDPGTIELIVEAIETQFILSIDARRQAYHDGIYKVAFGPEDGEVHRHPQLATAMFRGYANSLDNSEPDERQADFKWTLWSVLAICTEGPRESRDYSAALTLLRELYPLEGRSPTDGINDFEEWMLYASLSENHRTVLPEASSAFTELIQYELAAINAGKYFIDLKELYDERIVPADGVNESEQELRTNGATDIMSVDNEDGTFTQYFGTGDYTYQIPFMGYATQAHALNPDLDVAGTILTHPSFSTIPESNQLKILKGFLSDAEETNQPELVTKWLAYADEHLPTIASELHWDRQVEK